MRTCETVCAPTIVLELTVVTKIAKPEYLCVAAALDENGVAYLGTMWASGNSGCVRDPIYNATCPTWGTYIMAVQQP